jgi:hypothetical protein
MQLEMRIKKGVLLEMQSSGAMLHVSEFCSEGQRGEYEVKAKQVMARLGKTEERMSGVFFRPDQIVMENRDRSKRVQFTWKGGAMAVSELSIPSSNDDRRPKRHQSK